MKRAGLAVIAALALSGCVTPTSGPGSSASGGIPSTPVDLGAWRTAPEAATLAAFRTHIESRYAVGLALGAVSADLRRNEFACGDAPPRTEAGRGDPPAQVCRRTISQSGCTHTWQVHLFVSGADGRIARTRPLYDRRCGGDGLLGGPG